MNKYNGCYCFSKYALSGAIAIREHLRLILKPNAFALEFYNCRNMLLVTDVYTYIWDLIIMTENLVNTLVVSCFYQNQEEVTLQKVPEDIPMNHIVSSQYN